MEFWKEVRRQVLTGELSQRAAIRQYGLGWHTLKKTLAHGEPPGYRQRQPRKKRTLQRFLPVIHQILDDDRQAPKKQRHTAHRIFERLRDEHSDTGGETVVKDEGGCRASRAGDPDSPGERVRRISSGRQSLVLYVEFGPNNIM